MSNFNTFLEKFKKKDTGNLIVVLDQIVDPQNFASIVRSAFFLGVDFIMINKVNKPPLSSTVSKVSSGASECTDLFSIKNIKNFLGGKISV